MAALLNAGLRIRLAAARRFDHRKTSLIWVGFLPDLWVSAFFPIERDIDIAGFRGFAVVREFPAGSSPMGFGTLPLAVISRQWWLSGHGLDLEIQGIAPIDSTTLQRTIDLTVGSLRADNG